MPSYTQLEAIAALFNDFTIDDKALLVELMGLLPAFCQGCNCTLGSPYCHPLPRSVTTPEEEPQLREICPEPCPYDDEEDDD